MTTEEYITKNWLKMSDKKISRNIKTPLIDVISIRHRLGLKKNSITTQYHKINLETNAKCYEMFIDNKSCVEISKALNVSITFASYAISRFLPYFGANKVTITLPSKI